MQTIPLYISISLMVTVLFTVFIFYKATNNSKIILFILLGWLLLQSITALSGFYTITDTRPPPRFVLVIIPPLILIAIFFISAKGRNYMDSLNIKMLTLLHVVRIPVEIILLGLFIHKTIPQLMTFEGRNFDIFSGITAPLIYYFGFVKNKISVRLILVWNFVCLLLLINILMSAILSAPFTFQQFAFNQPNIAILYFPYVWLPCCIVPLILFSHLVIIRRLLMQ